MPIKVIDDLEAGTPRRQSPINHETSTRTAPATPAPAA